jgi:hypothetical protein
MLKSDGLADDDERALTESHDIGEGALKWGDI